VTRTTPYYLIVILTNQLFLDYIFRLYRNFQNFNGHKTPQSEGIESPFDVGSADF